MTPPCPPFLRGGKHQSLRGWTSSHSVPEPGINYELSSVPCRFGSPPCQGGVRGERFIQRAIVSFVVFSGLTIPTSLAESPPAHPPVVAPKPPEATDVN